MEHYILDTDYAPLGSGEQRSEGLHLTRVIYDIQKELGWDYKGEGFQDRDFTMDLGFVWEEVLSHSWALRHNAVRPGEVTKDGIIGSPDGMGPRHDVVTKTGEVKVPASKRIILYEYKLTWKSINHSVIDDWYYMTQGKSYCHMLGLKECIWHVGHLMGDYKGSGPLYRQCWVKFTDRELWNNWEMIVNHAQEKGWLE